MKKTITETAVKIANTETAEKPLPLMPGLPTRYQLKPFDYVVLAKRYGVSITENVLCMITDAYGAGFEKGKKYEQNRGKNARRSSRKLAEN